MKKLFLLTFGAGWARAGAVSPISSAANQSLTASASSTSSAIPSYITAPATLPYGGQAIPINTCSYLNTTNNQYYWNDPWCSVFAGTVKLTYWPTDNKTYPSTVYDPVLDYTYTSPSVYMVINTISAWNPCGQLGPTFSNAIFAFDLTDVSTLAPYTTGSTRQTRQLYLSDLTEDCPTSVDLSSLQTQTHPTKNADVRCNPSLVIPVAIKSSAAPYWWHCGNVHNKFGLFDPPYAISAANGLLDSSSTPVPPPPTSASTPSPASAPPPPPPPTLPPATTAAASSSEIASSPRPPQSSDSPANFYPSSKASSPAGVDVPTGTGASSDANAGTDAGSGAYTNTGANTDAGTNANTVTVDASPDMYKTSVVPTQIVSLGPSGLEVVDGSSDGRKSTYYVPGGETHTTVSAGATNPTASPPSIAVYQGQTLTLGGPAVTMTSVTVVIKATMTVASSSAIGSTTGTSLPTVVTASGSKLMRGDATMGILLGLLYFLL